MICVNCVQGEAESDDEDDSELGVTELEVALQALQYKRSVWRTPHVCACVRACVAYKGGM